MTSTITTSNATIRPGMHPLRVALGDISNKNVGGPIPVRPPKIIKKISSSSSTTNGTIMDMRTLKSVISAPLSSHVSSHVSSRGGKRSAHVFKSSIPGMKRRKEDEEISSITSVDIMDIDRDDTDPQDCPDLVFYVFRYLRSLERELSIPIGFLTGSSITPKMRSVLIDWLMEVHSQFTLEEETMYLTVSIIDMFLSKTNVKRKQLQLVGVTSMLIASKCEDKFSPEIADFVYITDDTYTAEEIRRMEKTILKTLNFRINRPMSLHFLRRWSKAGNYPHDESDSLAKYFLEASWLDHEFSHEPPSLCGAGALFLALKITSNSSTWTPSQEYYSGYRSNELFPVVRKFASLIYYSDTSKFRAPHEKFASRSESITLLPKLKSDMMKAIVEGQF